MYNLAIKASIDKYRKTHIKIVAQVNQRSFKKYYNKNAEAERLRAAKVACYKREVKRLNNILLN